MTTVFTVRCGPSVRLCIGRLRLVRLAQRNVKYVILDVDHIMVCTLMLAESTAGARRAVALQPGACAVACWQRSGLRVGCCRATASSDRGCCRRQYPAAGSKRGGSRRWLAMRPAASHSIYSVQLRCGLQFDIQQHHMRTWAQWRSGTSWYQQESHRL
eukprot:476672-Prymnesium_polylepis.1